MEMARRTMRSTSDVGRGRREARTASFSPTQRQYLVLYRLAQLGYASREHLIRACFRDVTDASSTRDE